MLNKCYINYGIFNLQHPVSHEKIKWDRTKYSDRCPKDVQEI